MNLIQFQVLIDSMVNSTGVIAHFKTNFMTVVQNQLLPWKPSMLQQILQDRHVNYREIETTLGISVTSIHSILHGLLHLHLQPNDCLFFRKNWICCIRTT